MSVVFEIPLFTRLFDGPLCIGIMREYVVAEGGLKVWWVDHVVHSSDVTLQCWAHRRGLGWVPRPPCTCWMCVCTVIGAR